MLPQSITTSFILSPPPHFIVTHCHKLSLLREGWGCLQADGVDVVGDGMGRKSREISENTFMKCWKKTSLGNLVAFYTQSQTSVKPQANWPQFEFMLPQARYSFLSPKVTDS